ncbi:hypothetical protein K2E96_16435 [Pseudomonas sp. ERGC3:05]|nr:hypothetical protein K2E96_16435 [Pseudomonas sp. ERGC3:05]
MAVKLKEAVQIAIDSVMDLFSSQSISSVLLEEVDRNGQGDFLITVGFERPNPNKSAAMLLGSKGIAGLLSTQRAYKVVRVSQNDGEVLSVKDRILESK